MSVERTVRHEASDGQHGMTLAELAAFVKEAEQEKMPGETRVRVVLTWRSSIKKVEVKGA